MNYNNESVLFCHCDRAIAGRLQLSIMIHVDHSVADPLQVFTVSQIP